jgi:hypothetical protein
LVEWTLVKVKELLVAPLMAVPLKYHWQVGAGLPEAVTENRTLCPAATLWLCGWTVMAGVAAKYPRRMVKLSVSAT